jgi:carboxypeptidase Q
MLSIVAAIAIAAQPQSIEDTIAAMRKKGLAELGAYSMLKDLTKNVGSRLSGSAGAAKSIVWVKNNLTKMGATNVGEIACMVPYWTRGKGENAVMNSKTKLSICALGGSVATPKTGIEAEVIEVYSLKEAEQLGDKGKGKIVFFNRPFDTNTVSSATGYGSAIDQRVGGATAAAKSGAVAVLVRSMTLATDDAPHTGAMRYGEAKKIPAAALGIQSANKLTAALKRGKTRVRLTLNCKTLPDVPSANAIGEIKGSELPNEVIVIGGHLDSWDLGTGAHDDGAGVVHAMEALRLIKSLGLKHKRTIRVVAWMNEENGGRGAKAYYDYAAKASEIHFAAMESDSGGFMPRAFGVSEEKLEKIRAWEPLLRDLGIERFVAGGADADNGLLKPLGTILFALHPEVQRYFDVHHSRNDVIENVHPRELEYGAIATAALAWLLSEQGDILK